MLCSALSPAYLLALTFVTRSRRSYYVLDLATFGVQHAELGRAANLDFACCRRFRHG